MTRPTSVTFDLWQTLIVDTPELGRPRAMKRIDGVQDALSHANYHFSREDLVDAYRRCHQICDKVRKGEGDVSFDEQVDIFLREVDIGMAKELDAKVRIAVAERYANSYLEHPPDIDEGAHRVLETVRSMGLKVALICNTGATPGATQRAFLGRVGLAQHFDTLTFSDEERLSKPAFRIFQLTLERIGAMPGETVHIGDHPRNDVEGAKRAGLRAIWLRRDHEQSPKIAPDASIDSLIETLRVLDEW